MVQETLTQPGELLRCHTCGKLVEKVHRVVAERGYNAGNKTPLYNCQECYDKKNAERRKRQCCPV